MGTTERRSNATMQGKLLVTPWSGKAMFLWKIERVPFCSIENKLNDCLQTIGIRHSCTLGTIRVHRGRFENLKNKGTRVLVTLRHQDMRTMKIKILKGLSTIKNHIATRRTMDMSLNRHWWCVRLCQHHIEGLTVEQVHQNGLEIKQRWQLMILPNTRRLFRAPGRKTRRCNGRNQGFIKHGKT